MRTYSRAGIVVVAGLLFAVGVFSQVTFSEEDKTESKPAARPAIYPVVLYAPGAKWEKDKAFHKQPGIGNHVKYLESLKDKGQLLLGGPFVDGSGGLVVLRGIKVKQAKQVVADDPAVRSGVLKGTVRPWLVPLRADR